MPMLSLLIPTLTERAGVFARLLDCLRPQVDQAAGAVEVLSLEDQGQQTTGAKRNRLLAAARGEYVAFVDDDDLLAVDYCPRVLAALADDSGGSGGPDAVGFILEYHQLKAPPRLMAMTTESAGTCPWQVRPINHLCPTRILLARQIGYPDKTLGEDIDYGRRLAASRLLGRVTFLGPPSMYQYLYNPGKPRPTNPPPAAAYQPPEPRPCLSPTIPPPPSPSHLLSNLSA